MSDGQKLPAVRYRLTAYRYPLSYWTVFPKAGVGARLRRRGDSPALTRGLRVVVSPDGDEHKMPHAAKPPLVAGATTFLHGKAGALWMLGSGVKVSLWQQRRENHTTGLRPEENKPTVLTGDGNAPLLPPVGDVSPRESVSRDFQVAVVPLQITFACHPGGGDLLSTQLLDS